MSRPRSYGALAIAGRGIGFLAASVLAVLWISIMWFEIDGFKLEGFSVAWGAFMALVALVGAIAAWQGHAGILFLAFVVSFFGVGWFSLNVENWFRAFGVLDLLLLLASVMLWVSKRDTVPSE